MIPSSSHTWQCSQQRVVVQRIKPPPGRSVTSMPTGWSHIVLLSTRNSSSIILAGMRGIGLLLTLSLISSFSVCPFSPRPPKITLLISLPKRHRQSLRLEHHQPAGRQTDRRIETERQTDRQIGRQRDKQADWQTGRQTYRQIEMQTDRQTGGKTDFVVSRRCILTPEVIL